MNNDIISKWVVNYKNWHVGITADSRVFDMDSKVEMIQHLNNGTLSFRIPFTTKKIGKLTLKKHCRLEKQVIVNDIPF